MAENRWIAIGLFHVSGIIHVLVFFVVGAHLVGSFFSRNLYVKKNTTNKHLPLC